MSKFIGRRTIDGGTGGDGYSDHGQLSGLGDDDHIDYLITSSIRQVESPTSGIQKTGSTSGDVFSLINSGSGAALYIKQIGTVTDADAAVDIDNTDSAGRGLSVFSSSTDPDLPLVQFSATEPSFDEPVLKVTHASQDGTAIEAIGDAYVSSQIDVGEAVTFSQLGYNPVQLGDVGIYVDSDGEGSGGIFYFVDANGDKHTFGDADLTEINNDIQEIINVLDGYHPDITGTEHYNQHSEAIQSILGALDGYITSYLDTDELVKVSATDLAAGYLQDKIFGGYNISVTKQSTGGNEWLKIDNTLSLDGYASDQTVSEHYHQHSDAIDTILNSLDGYASDITVSEHYHQHSTVIQTIINDLDGYASDQTVSEHYEQHNSIIQTILGDLDGYASDQTVSEHYHQHSDAIQTILSELDGYHPDSTGSEHYRQHSDALQAILKQLDGYSTSDNDDKVRVSADDGYAGYLEDKIIGGVNIDVSVIDDGYSEYILIDNVAEDELVKVSENDIEAGFLEEKLSPGHNMSLTIIDDGYYEKIQIGSTLQLDGYAADSTVSEHYRQHSEALQAILNQLDGYADGYTVDEHYIQFGDIIQTIINDLDGYASNQTVSEHYNQHSTTIQTILKQIDGYASDQTVSEHYTQFGDIIQTILKELDGYGSGPDQDYLVKVSGTDGYAGYLVDKIIGGINIDVSTLDDGYSEYIVIDNTMEDQLVKVSEDDVESGYLEDKIVAGENTEITITTYNGVESMVISSTGSSITQTDSVIGDGYFPFIEVDELEMSGDGSGTLPNTTGTDTDSSITRDKYNEFSIGEGLLEIKGVTLRSTIDADLYPDITYAVIKNATLVDDNVSNTVLSGGTLLFEDEPVTSSETYISGNRKDGEIQFTTGTIDFDDSAFSTDDGNPDGYFFFVFSGDHTLDTKTVLIKRFTVGGRVESITFTYPTCSFSGSPQASVRSGQTFDIEVTTVTDGYAPATSVRVDSGDAIQSNVWLTETPPSSGTWLGTVTASSTQPNGYADINVTVFDAFANQFSTDTTETGDPLVLFDGDFPVIESFSEGADLSYPPNQSCLKYGESLDSYMTVSDFTEILYSSPNGRISIENPTTYSEVKTMTWDQGSSGIEENANILSGLTTTNVRIRARKETNCSETTRNMQIRLDDTPPTISSIRWRRDNIGSYVLTSPTLGVGTHGVRVIFDDPLVILPEMIVQDENKGTLSAFSGSVPGTTFYATLTVTDPGDTNGCTELVLVTGINCSHKVPLAADPISGSDEVFCIDVLDPLIVRVEIDVYPADGYWNDGYDGPNAIDDDVDNWDNTEQACELDFSSGVQSITATETLTRHGESVYVSVEMNSHIESGDTCSFDASPWGASSSLSVAQSTELLYQGPFTTALGSTRNDDQGRAIGRASIFHATGGDATVTDLAENSDSASNTDPLSANGIDDVASGIAFSGDGTAGGTFQVSTDYYRAFMIGRKIKISDDNTSAVTRTVTDANAGTITCDGGSLADFTVAQNAEAVPLGVTDAEVAAWDVNNGIVAYVNDGAFTHLTLIDMANPEAFSQHLTNDQLTQNNLGTVDVDLFRANFWGSKISVPNTNGGTEANPTAVAEAKYVWRSKRIRLTTNPTGVQGTNLRFMVFGFSAGTSYRNVSISSTSDWDQNANKFDLSNNDSQIEIRISTDDPFAAIPPYTIADWHETTSYIVSPQSGFKFGKSKDINLVFESPSTDVIDKDIYIEVTLITNVSGKAPQIDMIALSYLT